MNESFLRFSRYRRDEVIGHTAPELGRWLDPEERAHVLHIMHEQGAVRDVEARFRTKSGEVRWARLSLERIELHGEPCLLIIAHDVTTQRQLEAQLRQAQKMEAVGTLASGIAHDFNNILAAMLGYTELTLDDVAQDSRAWCNLQAVLTAGQRARDLVRQILTFSRQTEPQRQPLRLDGIIQDALKLLRASIPSTIEIRQRIHTDAGTVLADATQMHQVLMNLCANAAQAMRQSGGVLEVSLEEVLMTAELAAALPNLEPGPYIRFTVRDTGRGMEPEVLERIFEPFFTTKALGEGTGMGLAQAHGIVTNHDGVISVESTPGQGATFTVYLPQCQETSGPEAPPEDPIPGGNECLLFVDDEPPLARLGQEMLERLGYQVVIRTSSVEALEAFRANPQRFDLVIADQTMPHLTGEALTRELRCLRPDMPIILCTGFSHTMTAEKAQALGIDAFCLKPLLRRDLALCIRQVLALRAAPAPRAAARILLIDDDPQIRAMLRQALERAGYTVSEASDGREGLRHFQATQPDLVITDLLMPEQEGLETMQALRRACPDVKIIAISGGGRRGTLDFLPLAQKLGAHRTFRKPFRQQELLAAVHELIGR